MSKNTHFSQPVSIFHGRHMPENDAILAGYAALIRAYDLQVPLPDVMAAISHKHKVYQKNDWLMFSPRHQPHDSMHGHLVFALKYEGINLAVLNALFSAVNAEEIEDFIKLEPTGSYNRRIWFLYEWLRGELLNIPDATKGNLVDVVDDTLQFPGPAQTSKRHRVRNNLPGVTEFCPMIRRTARLEKFHELNLKERARSILTAIHPDVLLRAAAFILLKDSKASYAIEGESPPQNRAERWGAAIGQAGNYELSHDEFLRLQEIIISDFRFTHHGYRNAGGFIGTHERATGLPIPDHISARSQDLRELMDGLIKTHLLLRDSDFDPILAAAIIAFGFVFIHPLEDGNGRIHRYLIHHVLAEKHFVSSGIVFPVSSVILNHILEYRKVLESYSKPRLAFIKWKPTDEKNVEVLNDTIDLYRYFDATKQAEFLYQCIEETVEKTLPEEVEYLKKYDAMKYYVKNSFDMPDRLVDLLIIFLNQENGTLSKRARSKEFNTLTPLEVELLEKKYAEIFLLSDF